MACQIPHLDGEVAELALYPMPHEFLLSKGQGSQYLSESICSVRFSVDWAGLSEFPHPLQ